MYYSISPKFWSTPLSQRATSKLLRNARRRSQLVLFPLISIWAGSSLVFEDSFLFIYILIYTVVLLENGKNSVRWRLILKETARRKVFSYFLGPHFQKFLAQKKWFKPAFVFHCFPLSQTLRYAISTSQGLLTMYLKSWICILWFLRILHTAVRRRNELEAAATVDLPDLLSQSMSPSLTYGLLRDWQKAQQDDRTRRTLWELFWALTTLESIPRKTFWLFIYHQLLLAVSF